jgi:hypothetical protein
MWLRSSPSPHRAQLPSEGPRSLTSLSPADNLHSSNCHRKILILGGTLVFPTSSKCVIAAPRESRKQRESTNIPPEASSPQETLPLPWLKGWGSKMLHRLFHPTILAKPKVRLNLMCHPSGDLTPATTAYGLSQHPNSSGRLTLSAPVHVHQSIHK